MNFKSPGPIGLVAALFYALFQAQAFASSTTVTVNFGSSLAAMPPLGLGVDCAVYDNILISSTVASQMKAGGIQAMRYPGGSYADIFNWQNSTVIAGAYMNANDSFDNFMNTVVNPAGAKAIITVNYGSNPSNNGGGDPAVAAAWVKYANITKGWGISYWEIGNENAGNGYYGNQDWEYDLHFLDQTPADRVGQPALSPAAYGQNAVPFVQAMKAQDPTIKCGVGISLPHDWPDTASPSYNQQLLSNCGSAIDFVIIHWYPGGDATALLQTPLQIAGIVSATKSELNTYAGSHGSQIQLLITETGAGNVTGPATTLFAADDYLSWLENGVANVDYEELHNGFLTSSDAGIADNSPAGPYYGAKLASLLAATGETFVSASSGSTLLGVHAVRKANGHYDVMLINRDPNNANTVTVNVSGATLASSGTLYQFGQANFNGTYPSSGVSQSTIAGIATGSFSITVPAYTISLVDVAPGSGGGGGGGGGTIANGTYKIINRNSGLALDVKGATTTNTSRIDQWPYNATSNQKWMVTSLGSGEYSIVGVGSGKALDVYVAGTANGTVIDIYTPNNGANQKWSFTATSSGYYRITPANATGSCLDVTGASTAEGTAVDLWNYSGGNNQQWIFQAP